MNYNLLVLSHATYVGPSGATAAATYSFFTKEYRPPSQDRSIEFDIVHNQNGRFKWVYDNGPGFNKWQGFSVLCENKFATVVGAIAATQFSRIREMWEYPGVLGMKAPEGTYSVHWSSSEIERAFRAFPTQTTDVPEWEVVVQFEEST